MFDPVSILLGWGVPKKFIQPIIIAATVVAVAGAAIGAWQLWLNSHDRQVLEQGNAKALQEATERARGADEEAATQARADDRRAFEEDRELERVNRNDEDRDKPASDADRDYLRCIGLQQRARRDGKPAPICG